MHSLRPWILSLFAICAARSHSFDNALQFTGQQPMVPEVDSDHSPHWPPWHHPPKPDERTIYQLLNETSRFSLFSKAINFAGDDVVSFLNDSSASLTFFAIPNRFLRRRKLHDSMVKQISDIGFDLDAFYEDSPSLELGDMLSMADHLEFSTMNGDEKERRREFLRKVVRAYLAYNTLPSALSASDLAQNTTFATNITFLDAQGGQPLRIRTAARFVPPSLSINVFSKVVYRDINVTNGYIHVVNRPIAINGPAFQTLYNVPSAFSTLTSAIQHSGLENATSFKFQRGSDDEWELEGTTSGTFFAPTNTAFKALPIRLRLFLFSPLGSRIMKKILQYHVVPSVVFHSDYTYNSTSNGPVTPLDIDEGTLLSDFASLHGDSNTCSCGLNENSDSFHHRHFSGPSASHPPCFHDKERFYQQDSHTFNPHDDSAAWDFYPGEDYSSYVPPPPDGREERRPRHSHPRMPVYPPSFAEFEMDDDENENVPEEHHRPKHPVVSKYTLPTALTNSSVDVTVAKFKRSLPLPHHRAQITSFSVFANGKKVSVADVPSVNGAIHVVNKLVVPKHKKHSLLENGQVKVEEVANDWEDWEEWLMDWAAEN